MKITLKDVLEGKEYAPLPGTEFEIAPGCTVRLKPPTMGLRRQAEALRKELLETVNPAAGDDLALDFEFARLVTEGTWPNDDDCFPAVVSEVCAAYFRSLRPGRLPG